MDSHPVAFLCVIFAISMQSAPARLGDTVEQCNTRYGKPEVIEAKAPRRA